MNYLIFKSLETITAIFFVSTQPQRFYFVIPDEDFNKQSIYLHHGFFNQSI